MTREEALAEKYVSRSELINKIYDDNEAQLKALQSRSCESCKHWKVRNKLVRSNECFKWSGSVMTPRGFYCSEFEAKEQKHNG